MAGLGFELRREGEECGEDELVHGYYETCEDVARQCSSLMYSWINKPTTVGLVSKHVTISGVEVKIGVITYFIIDSSVNTS